jgi:peptidoglycan/LPS O-acetylase OafA/YrhL
MTLAAGRPERLLYFDGLRGIAALSVALFHFPTVSVLDRLPIVENGWLFVDMFFVLSGFILDRVYFTRGASFVPFALTRAARMMPLYYLIFLFSIPFDAFRVLRDPGGALELVKAGMVNLVALQSFGLLDRLWFYGPSWSISAEIWVNFLIFPVIMTTAGRKLLPAITAVLAVAFMTTLDIQTSHEYGALRCAYGIGLGIIVSRLLLTGRASFSGLPPALTDAFFVLLLVFGLSNHPWQGALPIGFALLVFMLALSERSLTRRLLSTPPAVFLGRVSFALYMTHYIVGGRIFRAAGLLLERSGSEWVTRTSATEWQGLKLGGSEATALVWIALYLIVCLGVATAVNRWIEEPVYAWLRAGFGKPRVPFPALAPQ